MYDIKYATADYTGGGIYRYTGSVGDGLYFMAATDWDDYVIILDADPDKDPDAAGYDEWQNSHRWTEFTGRDAEDFMCRVFDWIIKNTPEGNYCTGDILNAKAKLDKTDNSAVKVFDDRVEIIRECYSPEHDMTFLRKDVESRDGVLISMEVVGFYSGEPDAEATRTYNGSLKAEYPSD